MVVGHTSISNAISSFIYAFHMPLFFIASGFTVSYVKYSPLGYIQHKARTIMLPFITYSIIARDCSRLVEICDGINRLLKVKIL